MGTDRPVSSLILSELYDSGDGAFVDTLLNSRGSFKPLLGLIERWKKDRRPSAQRLKLQFILSDRLTFDARVVFKRILKQAWADQDSELMAAFMVTVDRMIRRKRAKRYRYLRGNVETTEVLRLRRDAYIFSTPTTHYLRRRAWRYFRKLGFRDGAAYVANVSAALVRYTDEDIRAGENLLDNWGLMHACFGKSSVLSFNSRHTNLAATGRLSELRAAPMFERHWAQPDSLSTLLNVLVTAQCRAVRTWSIELLRRLHNDALPKLNAEMILRLIDHTDPDVAAFAAELLSNAQAVSAFPMNTWMELLATRNPAVVTAVVESFRKHVSFDRVTLAQAVELTSRVPVPVVTLGLEILNGKDFRSDSQQRELAMLSRARCAAAGRQIALFAIPRLNVAGVYRVDEIVAFFDSRLRTLRDGAFEALASQSPADTDPGFWARLFESPYDDVRSQLVSILRARESLPGTTADLTASLWRSVLLNVHRGGRVKLSALRQISDRIVREPSSIQILLPVLAVALRSVRPPEARDGLAAIVRAVDCVPAIANDVRRFIPELELNPLGAGQ